MAHGEIALLTCEAFETHTGKHVIPVHACSVITWVRVTVVQVVLTITTGESRKTIALVCSQLQGTKCLEFNVRYIMGIIHSI